MSLSLRNRRAFLRDAVTTGGGLAIAFHLPACTADRPWERWGGPGEFVPNACLRITPDNRVIYTLGQVEMGQGTLTSQTMVVAEELNLKPKDIEVELATNHADFADPSLGVQVTGGSASTRTTYAVLQQVGARAREALLAAAGLQLGVSASELTLVAKTVTHAASGRTVSFGELTEGARDALKSDATPKPRHAWTVVGRDHTRLDAQRKVDGTAEFGADYDPPGLETAVIVRGPLGSSPTNVDAEDSEKVRGVKEIVTTPYGVAVVAQRYHQARKAADRLQVEWTPSTFSTDGMWKRYARALDGGDGTGNARSDGDSKKALSEAEQVIEAEYHLPYLSHATMEPQNCTVDWKPDVCHVWAGTQGPAQCALAAAEVTGISRDKVKVHQTLLGGGFGRRIERDFVEEAAYLSKHRKAPVRVQWSREDDVQNDFYRPASLHRLRGAVQGGQPVAWEHRIVQQSIMSRIIPDFLEERMPGPMAGLATWAMTNFSNDGSICEGADKVPYALENVSVGYQVADEPVPVGFWRSVGHSSNGFVVESFIDELAHAAKADPFEFRRNLLKEHPRHRDVLETAAKAALWGQPLGEGRAQGIAVHESFHSYVAVVAEVSASDDGIRVHKLIAAVDCGLAVHPDGVRAQIEGGMIFALGPTLTQSEITFRDGRVEQSNFHDFQSLRMNQAPEVEVHIVDSDEPPTGVGEPGVPPTAAAVANAVFALTNQRLRRLPLKLA